MLIFKHKFEVRDVCLIYHALPVKYVKQFYLRYLVQGIGNNPTGKSFIYTQKWLHICNSPLTD